MKYFALMLILVLTPCTSTLAEEPRTVGVYKRHMSSSDHNANDFDHTLHHLLYLSGVADAYASINKRLKDEQKKLLYCQPQEPHLSGSDIMKILNKKLYHPERPAADNLTVSEALLLALQEEYPCQEQN